VKSSEARKPSRCYQFSNSKLVPRGDPILHLPVYVISADKAIIPDHDTIDTQAFLTFLREFVSAFTAHPAAPRR
jgi:hypothetical protein